MWKHKSYIEHAQICGNLILSYENDGLLAVTLISFEDAEEYSSKFIHEHAESKVLSFKYFEDTSELIVLTKTGGAYLYHISVNEAASDFSITLRKSIDQIFAFAPDDMDTDKDTFLRNVFVQYAHWDWIVVTWDFRAKEDARFSFPITFLNLKNFEVETTINYDDKTLYGLANVGPADQNP